MTYTIVTVASPQAANQPEVLALLSGANESLANAIQRLNGDNDLELQRQWLELLLGALRQNGMFGLQELLKGTKGDGTSPSDRELAAQAIAAAAAAVSQAAGLLYHPKAVGELKRVSEAIGALRHRVAESASVPIGEGIQMGEEYVALRKFAGMLLGQGLSDKKLKGLQKARDARNAKRRNVKEDLRLAKNRGAIPPLGL